MKRCSRCKETKFLDMFYRCKTNKKDGYHNQCKACKKAYYEANKEKILERGKAYQQANKEKIAERRKDYFKAHYEANKEKILERKKAHYEANKEKILEYHKAYNEANKERIKAYYEANKEKILEQQKDYQQANKDKLAEINSRYRARKIRAIPKFLRNCEVEKKRLQDTFKLRDLITQATGIQHHVDHMWPLSKGGPHWSGNLQIIPATENLSKKDKLCKTLKKNIKDSLRIAKEEYTNEDNCNGHRD